MGISEDTYTQDGGGGGRVNTSPHQDHPHHQDKEGSENERLLESDLDTLGNSQFEFSFPMLIQFVPL